MTNPENANASLAGEANAESADMGGLHDERSTAKSPLREVAYSRGTSKYDNTPAQLTAPDFAAFRDAILADRAKAKGQQYIAAPFAPDPALAGQPHRNKACALPRRFIGLDVDGATPAAFAAAILHLQRYSGLAYTTASHTPAAPRFRVVLELDMPAPRDELIAASRAIRARIDAALAEEGHAALPWDNSCDRPEQPLYLPLVDAQSYVMDGAPLVLGELLADMPQQAVQDAPQAPRAASATEPTAWALHALDKAVRAVAAAPEGDRNNVLNREAFGMGGFVATGQLSAPVVEAALFDATQRAGYAAPDADRRKIADGVRAGMASPRTDGLPAPPAAANDAAPNNVRKLFTLTRADRIERKATDWLIRGYLVRDTLAALVAKPGACKSFLAVDWACRIATGTDWYGREVKPGAVFYLAGEGQRGLRKRIDGWEKHNRVTVAGAPLFIASGMPFLCDQLNVAGTLAILKETAEELRASTGVAPAMIVIDTVARAMNGANENATEDMGKFIAACDTLRHEWQCTVLAVHHTGNDPGAQDRGRGNSNFGASMDSDFYLKPKDGGLELKAGAKSKDWRTPPTLMLSKVEIEVDSIGDEGEPVKETTLALHDAAGAMADMSKREMVERLHLDGLSIRAVAERTGVPTTTIHRWLKHAA